MTAPSILTGSVTILNQGAIGAAAMMPTSFAAGSDRLVWAVISTYDGGSTTNIPTAVACNGRVPTLVAGSTTPVNRTATGIYQFNEADIPFIANQSLTSTGATGSQKNIEVFVLQNCKQEATPRSNSGHLDATGTLALPLTRIAESFTFGYAFTSSADTLLTLTNPTRVGSTLFTTRRASYGYAADTARTVDFTVAGSNRTYGVVLNVAPVPAQAITTVNSGNPVKIGGTVSVSVSGFTKAITKGTIDGVPLTVASSSSVTLPNLVDGAQLPRKGAARVLFLSSADDTETATTNIEVANPDGWASTVIEVGFSTGEADSINYDFDPPLAADDILFFDPAKGTVYPNAGYEGTYSGTQTMWHHDVSTLTAYSFPLITGSAAVPTTPFTRFGASLITVSGDTLRIDGTTHTNGTPVSLSLRGGLRSDINGKWVARSCAADSGDLVLDGVTISPPSVLYLDARGKLSTTPNGQPVATVR